MPQPLNHLKASAIANQDKTGHPPLPISPLYYNSRGATGEKESNRAPTFQSIRYPSHLGTLYENTLHERMRPHVEKSGTYK